MQTGITHLEKKATKLIQLSGLEEKVAAILPHTSTKEGTSMNEVLINFKGDRSMAEASAKEFYWWWNTHSSDPILAGFDEYAIAIDNTPEDSPVITFFKCEVTLIDDESEGENVPNPGTDGAKPKGLLSIEEIANKMIQMAGQKENVDEIRIVEDDKPEGNRLNGDLAVIILKGTNRAEKEALTKDFFWWISNNNGGGREFEGYTAGLDTDTEDEVPIICIFREQE